MSIVSLVLDETMPEVHRELPMTPIWYLIIALALFLVALAVTWSFRGTAQKIRSGEPHHAPGHHFGEHH